MRGEALTSITGCTRHRARLSAASTIPGVRAARQGRNQVRLEIDPKVCGLSAADLALQLRSGEPAILAWDLHSESGTLLLTLGKVTDEASEFVSGRIIEILQPTEAAAKRTAAA
jgi:hypothetical protein